MATRKIRKKSEKCITCSEKNTYKKVRKWSIYQRAPDFIGLILSEFWECNRCGDGFYDEAQAKKHCKQVDAYLK